jgi:hypothetical protein
MGVWVGRYGSNRSARLCACPGGEVGVVVAVVLRSPFWCWSVGVAQIVFVFYFLLRGILGLWRPWVKRLRHGLEEGTVAVLSVFIRA